jgi:glc operon protein GlcG
MKTRAMLTLADCKKIMAAAEAEAVKNNWAVTIAILDDGGIPLCIQRMDGASALTAEIALQKGRTAALSGRPSKNWEDRIKDGRLAMLGMPVLPVQGGMPILANGERIGGVGVSGVQSHEDEQIASAGIAALGL